MSVNMSDPRVFGAFVGAVVALALWVLGRGFELVRDELRRGAIRHNLIRALFAEVDFNTRDMEIFRSRSPRGEGSRSPHPFS